MRKAMKLCVSLDLPSAKENLDLVEQIKDFDVWLKVGFRSYIRDGKKFLEDIKAINPNFKIFLDLKLYDIPKDNYPLCNSTTNLFLLVFVHFLFLLNNKLLIRKLLNPD
jgi:orotidine-5'-phosphate decarboxylase